MDSLDPAGTALLVVHMVKGVAGQVDTPFNRLFRQRAESAHKTRRSLIDQTASSFNSTTNLRRSLIYLRKLGVFRTAADQYHD
jgi:hypothetical protein